VSVVPGMDFGSHQPKAYVRLAYTTGLPQLREAVERIGRWLRA
jgi:aspartate/methionine/tyrosine aminotransferase